MNRRLILALVLLAAFAVPAYAETPHSLQSLSFLLGDWDAPGPKGSTGHTSFASSLQDQVIVRRNSADYPASGDQPASRHEDLMVIYVKNQNVLADYYDSEGHVIHYTVLSPGEGKALFVSTAQDNEPRYRLTYVLAPDGTLGGAFDVASPASPEAFKPYLSWKATKAAAAGAGH